MLATGCDEINLECDKNTKDMIKLKLLDIQEVFNLTNIDCKFPEQNNNYNSIGFNEARERLDIYANISKLSVYLMNDYEFFSQSTIQSAFKCPLYNTSMENLGYRRFKSTWTPYEKPHPDVIIENIFKYCLYSHIVKVKKRNHIPFDNQNKFNSSRTFSKNSENYCSNDQRTKPCRKNERFENQNREPQFYRKQEKQSFHDKNIQHKQKNENMGNRQNCKNEGSIERLQNPPRNNNNQFDVDKNEPTILQRKIFIKTTEKQAEINEVVDKWKCNICEMMNLYQNVFCEACDSKGPHFEKWRCSKCTYINEPNSMNCTACQAINGNVIDVVQIKKK